MKAEGWRHSASAGKLRKGEHGRSAWRPSGGRHGVGGSSGRPREVFGTMVRKAERETYQSNMWFFFPASSLTLHVGSQQERFQMVNM